MGGIADEEPADAGGAAGIDAAALWGKNCGACHAKDGTGSTKIGRKLGVRDYTDPEVQATMDTANMVEVIKAGITDEESGKTRMKPYAEKLSAEEIDALIEHIRALAPAKAEGAGQ